MGILRMILSHPDELLPLLKLKVAMTIAEKQIPSDPHLAFCYSTLNNVSKTFALIIQQLGTELRNTMCVFYLILRALDTVEDDENIPLEIRVSTLIAFHRHMFDPDWHFPCGTNEHKVLMDQFHHVSTAFLELDKRYQDAIEDITKRVGAGMAKFICKEVETLGEYDEYCHYAAGLVGIGMSKLFLASGLETLSPNWEPISNSLGLFLEKAHVIKDYHEDINAIPKERMFWPREIWGKYVNKLEDLKYKENSIKAVQCLSDMVTDALMHVEDSLKYTATLRDPAIFQLCAIPLIVDYGTIALCYNNIQVFRGVMRMRRGLVAKLMERTKTMDDAYGVFYDFSCIMKTKVNNNKNDPNASKLLNRLDAILKVCKDNGVLHKRKSYVSDEVQTIPLFVINMLKTIMLLLILVMVFVYPKAHKVKITKSMLP